VLDFLIVSFLIFFINNYLVDQHFLSLVFFITTELVFEVPLLVLPGQVEHHVLPVLSVVQLPVDLYGR
jgi:membrane-anchored glycerophosphoryl diester phosphodiesterase (GDPDase)